MNSIPPTMNGLHHVSIAVSDIEAATNFYVDILGFKLLKIDAALHERGIRWLQIPGSGILHLALQSDFNTASLRHFAIEVPDAERWREHLVASGLELVDVGVSVPNSIRVYSRDPSGNLFECVQWLD